MNSATIRTFAPTLKKLWMASAVGGVVCLLALVVQWSGLLRVAELKTLDHRFARYASPSRASPDIVLVAIDEPSLAAFGRWPWPRDRHGYMVRYLKEAGARAIVFDVLFLEPDTEEEVFDRDFAADIQMAGNVFLPLLMEHPMADTSRAVLHPTPHHWPLPRPGPQWPWRVLHRARGLYYGSTAT